MSQAGKSFIIRLKYRTFMKEIYSLCTFKYTAVLLRSFSHHLHYSPNPLFKCIFVLVHSCRRRENLLLFASNIELLVPYTILLFTSFSEFLVFYTLPQRRESFLLTALALSLKRHPALSLKGECVKGSSDIFIPPTPCAIGARGRTI